MAHYLDFPEEAVRFGLYCWRKRKKWERGQKKLRMGFSQLMFKRQWLGVKSRRKQSVVIVCGDFIGVNGVIRVLRDNRTHRI